VKFNVEVVFNERQFKNHILRAYVDREKQKFPVIKPAIEARVRDILANALLRSKTYLSLASADFGALRAHFGLTNASQKATSVVQFWVDSIHIKHYPTKKGSRFDIIFSKSDFSDVLSQPYAFQEATPSSFSLPWLKWLLLEGSGTIISNFHYTSNRVTQKYSRTNTGIMLPKGTWRVPAWAAGTQYDNWFTRVFQENLHIFHQAIYSEISKAL